MKKKALKFIALVSGFISACAFFALICNYLKEIKSKFVGVGEFAVDGVSGSVTSDGKHILKFGRKRKPLILRVFGSLFRLILKIVRKIIKWKFHLPFI